MSAEDDEENWEDPTPGSYIYLFEQTGSGISPEVREFKVREDGRYDYRWIVVPTGSERRNGVGLTTEDRGAIGEEYAVGARWDDSIAAIHVMLSPIQLSDARIQTYVANEQAELILRCVTLERDAHRDRLREQEDAYQEEIGEGMVWTEDDKAICHLNLPDHWALAQELHTRYLDALEEVQKQEEDTDATKRFHAQMTKAAMAVHERAEQEGGSLPRFEEWDAWRMIRKYDGADGEGLYDFLDRGRDLRQKRDRIAARLYGRLLQMPAFRQVVLDQLGGAMTDRMRGLLATPVPADFNRTTLQEVRKEANRWLKNGGKDLSEDELAPLRKRMQTLATLLDGAEATEAGTNFLVEQMGEGLGVWHYLTGNVFLVRRMLMVGAEGFGARYDERRKAQIDIERELKRTKQELQRRRADRSRKAAAAQDARAQVDASSSRQQAVADALRDLEDMKEQRVQWLKSQRKTVTAQMQRIDKNAMSAYTSLLSAQETARKQTALARVKAGEVDDLQAALRQISFRFDTLRWTTLSGITDSLDLDPLWASGTDVPARLQADDLMRADAKLMSRRLGEVFLDYESTHQELRSVKRQLAEHREQAAQHRARADDVQKKVQTHEQALSDLMDRREQLSQRIQRAQQDSPQMRRLKQKRQQLQQEVSQRRREWQQARSDLQSARQEVARVRDRVSDLRAEATEAGRKATISRAAGARFNRFALILHATNVGEALRGLLAGWNRTTADEQILSLGGAVSGAMDLVASVRLVKGFQGRMIFQKLIVVGTAANVLEVILSGFFVSRTASRADYDAMIGHALIGAGVALAGANPFAGLIIAAIGCAFVLFGSDSEIEEWLKSCYWSSSEHTFSFDSPLLSFFSDTNCKKKDLNCQVESLLKILAAPRVTVKLQAKDGKLYHPKEHDGPPDRIVLTANPQFYDASMMRLRLTNLRFYRSGESSGFEAGSIDLMFQASTSDSEPSFQPYRKDWSFAGALGDQFQPERQDWAMLLDDLRAEARLELLFTEQAKERTPELTNMESSVVIKGSIGQWVSESSGGYVGSLSTEWRRRRGWLTAE